MDFNKYSGYFHDGGIINIEQNDDNIIIDMESCEIRDDWEVNLPLSHKNTIRVKMYINGVKKISVNNKDVNVLKKQYDSGEIMNIDIKKNQFNMNVIWRNFLPKQKFSTFEVIEVEAEKIYWQNIPDLFNPKDS